MRIAYVASRYPLVSHTFIENEVRALRALGVSIETFSVRRPPPAEIPASDEARAEQRATRVLVGDRRDLVRAGAAAARRPGPTFAALVATVRRRDRRRSRLRQVFYFGEAVVLWWHAGRDEVTHLHAHLANVATDVVRAAAELRRRTHPDAPWTWSFTMHGPTEFSAVDQFGLPGKVCDADLVVCISDYCRSQLMAIVPAAHWSKLVVVHCGIATDRWVPVPRDRAPGEPLRVLCVGRLVPEKGQAVLLDAAARARAAGVDMALVFVGDGPDRDRLEAMARERGLQDAARFTGSLAPDEVREWNRWADVFCLASFAEGVPVVLMEAMASGIPVVATRITGIPELIDDGRNGVLVAPGRADLLADALTGLARDPARRGALGAAGREAVIAGYELSASALQLRAAFDGVRAAR